MSGHKKRTREASVAKPTAAISRKRRKVLYKFRGKDARASQGGKGARKEGGKQASKGGIGEALK